METEKTFLDFISNLIAGECQRQKAVDKKEYIYQKIENVIVVDLTADLDHKNCVTLSVNDTSIRINHYYEGENGEKRNLESEKSNPNKLTIYDEMKRKKIDCQLLKDTSLFIESKKEQELLLHRVFSYLRRLDEFLNSRRDRNIAA